MNRSSMRFGMIATCGLLASGCGASTSPEGPAPGTDSRDFGGASGSPAARVPEGYVATASGYQHASCVVQLSRGDEIFDQGASGVDVRRADGSVRHVDPCPYPTLKSTGEIIASSAAVDPPTVANPGTGSLHPLASIFPAYGQISPTPAPVKGLRSTMIVPGFRANENNNDTSQIDVWPGLENASPSNWVLQPVLELLASPTWVMMPVYNQSGNQFSAPAVNTFSGDIVSGTATGSNCNATTHVCSTWTVQLTDTTTGQSTLPLIVNSFTSVAQRLISGVVEIHSELPVTSCLSLPTNPLANLATETLSFSGFWSNSKPTIVKITQSPDCLYDAWVAPKGALSSVYLGWNPGFTPYPLSFDAGDQRGYEGLSDWAPGQYKSECGTEDWVVGVSANPSTGRAHSALCAYDGNVNSKLFNPSWSIAVDFSTTSVQRDTATGDWDGGYFKGECASNEAVTGIAQSTDGKLTKVLCTRMYQEVVAGACYRRIFQTGDNRGNTTGDWAYGYFKGQCDSPESTTVVKGVSRVTSTGQAHAILCCPTGFTP